MLLILYKDGYIFDGWYEDINLTVDNIETIYKKAFDNCSNIEIHGNAGSDAEEFADDMGITFVIL